MADHPPGWWADLPILDDPEAFYPARGDKVTVNLGDHDLEVDRKDLESSKDGAVVTGRTTATATRQHRRPTMPTPPTPLDYARFRARFQNASDRHHLVLETRASIVWEIAAGPDGPSAPQGMTARVMFSILPQMQPFRDIPINEFDQVVAGLMTMGDDNFDRAVEPIIQDAVAGCAFGLLYKMLSDKAAPDPTGVVQVDAAQQALSRAARRARRNRK